MILSFNDQLLIHAYLLDRVLFGGYKLVRRVTSTNFLAEFNINTGRFPNISSSLTHLCSRVLGNRSDGNNQN